ncbi:MAG: STAS domain-containing protein [Polyangiaceae bacterium]|nr:STAS domain-containing protein [Polyangiaceae bacterium]
MEQGTPSTEERLAEAKQRLVAKRQELEAKKKLVDELFHEAKDGVVILAPDGSSVLNPIAIKMFQTPDEGEKDWENTWGFFNPLTGEKIPVQELGSMRVMRGEKAPGYEEMTVVSPRVNTIHIGSHYGPLPKGGAVSIFRDISERVHAEKDVESQNQVLTEKNEEHRHLIERLRAALDELATPVLRVAKGVLVVPIIGLVDTQRASLVAERLLSEIVRDKAHSVVVDVTGVEVLDTTTADHLARLARAVKLLGARCMVSGIQPAVAQTLVALGVQLEALAPQRNLASALAACLRQSNGAAKPAAPVEGVR